MLVWCNINICDWILSVKSSFYLSSRRGGWEVDCFTALKKLCSFFAVGGIGVGNG